MSSMTAAETINWPTGLEYDCPKQICDCEQMEKNEEKKHALFEWPLKAECEQDRTPAAIHRHP
jgi:hypothetical protein